MDHPGAADAPLLSHNSDNDGSIAQRPAGGAGASVDPHYNAVDKDEGGRRSSMMSSDSESDLELDDIHTNYQRVGNDEERGLRENAREDHTGPMSPQDIADRRASIESMDMWREAAKMGKRAFLKKAAINASLILLWYMFSISISVVGIDSDVIYVQ